MTAQSITGTGPGSAEGPGHLNYNLDNIKKVFINQSGQLLPCIYIITDGNSGKYVFRAASDGQIKIDQDDDVPNYFLDKILPGANIIFSASPGPNKTLTISSSGGAATTSLVSGLVYSCPALVAINDVVYITGTDAADRANATSIVTVPVIGFVTSKPSFVTCVVTYAGEVTGFVGLIPGAKYFLNTISGGISTIAPSSSGNIVQRVGVARNTTTLVTQIDPNFIVL